MKIDIQNAEIVIDECVPAPLYYLFEQHNYSPVLGSIWEGKKNGKLLGLCRDNNVKVLVTCDKAMEREQIKNIHNYSVSIVILNSKTNDEDDVKPVVKQFIELYLSNKSLFKERTIYFLDEKKLSQCFIQKETNDGRVSIGYNDCIIF